MRCCSILKNNQGAVSRLLIFAVVVGALGYGYYYFKGTPRYTLIQFKKCVVFSDGPGLEKYVDEETFYDSLPEQVKRGNEREAVKKRVLAEIDSPHEKSTFLPIKEWDTIRVPIEIDGDTATVEQPDGSVITLQKVSKRQWLITSLQLNVRES